MRQFRLILFFLFVLSVAYAGSNLLNSAMSFLPLRDAFSFLPCGDDIVTSVPDPSGQYKATVLIRDCGATTDWSTLVFVRKTGFLGGETGVLLALKGRQSVLLAWKDKHTLVIHANTSDAFTQATYWKGINVLYAK